MKNLLIIAYYFPPSGGPGVQRVLKHVKYLSEFGWNPIVLTVENGQFPARDESLLAQIPDSTPVYRSHIFEPYDIYRFLTGKKPGSAIDVNTIKKDEQKIGLKEKIAELIRATFFIPDARMAWLFSANKQIKEIIKEYKIDAVYSSSPPYTCSLIARNFKRKYKCCWVAGFRDPWTDFISSPKRWFLPKAIDKAMEFSVFNEADSVECAWEGIIKDALGKYPKLNKDKFYHVPNGFDSSDFPIVEIKRNNKFTVTYTGSMYGRRNPASFFDALELLIKNKKIKPDEIHLRFVGRFGSEVEDMFLNSSFSDSIEKISYVPHHKSLEYLMTSDALLLVVDESKESDEIVPGKVYEYIGVKKPIIAIAPKDSAIAKLMLETKSGMIAHQSEIEKTADIIYNYYSDWKEGTHNFCPDESIIYNYERKEAARKLAELLNKLTINI
jgi:hypothetical protein